MAQNIESVLRPGALIQGHAKWEEDCSMCHVRFERAAQDRLCVDCHKEVGQDMRERTGFHGRQKAQPCRACHTDHKGRAARIVELDKKQFDHTQTDYALRGKHRQIECDKCHQPKKKYREAPAECNACHKKDDVHKGSLGAKCADCHSENDWKEKANFDHDKTRFPLKGKHADTKCLDCHKKGADYKDAPRNCIGCHKKDDDGIKGHKGLYGEKCDSCHGAKAWKPSTFNHDTATKYALRGKHRAARCADCHTGHLYKDKLGAACIDCHKKDDNGIKGHKGSLGRDCVACHSESGWKEKGKFDHDKTIFPLLGKHVEAKCADCHKSSNYKEASKDCIGCHKKDDKHEAQLGTRCEACHNDRDWKSTRFDHGLSRFALVGKHVAVKCKDCHASLRYKDAPSDCWGCHKQDDKHKLKFASACESCHNPRSWGIWDFDHTRRAKYLLDGAHVRVACEQCHKRPAPAGKAVAETGSACIACHRRDDTHDGAFGPLCEQCHYTDRWKRIRSRISFVDQQPNSWASVFGHSSRLSSGFEAKPPL